MLSSLELGQMLDRAQGAGSVAYRKSILREIADRAAASSAAKGRTKIRVEEFRNVLAGAPGNDEIEVAAPWFCELVTLAMMAGMPK
jgi:hypothetical protein